jgi:bacillithiol synthase
MKSIDFRDLPNQTNLFLDYIYDFEKVKKYYNGNFRSEEDVRNSINTALNRKIDRELLASVLTEYNRNFGDTKALGNIELLKKNNTVAVVTGQQLGLYSGPLYTIYKTIGVLKLSNILNNRYPDYNFVPVFWLEAEDHDFLEINKVRIIDKENNFFTHEYLPENKPVEKNMGAMGGLTFDEFISDFNNNVFSTLTLTEFTKNIDDIIKDIYKSGRSLEESFCLFIRKLLPESGLIFINPNTRDIKKMLVPVFEKEINEYPKTSEMVINDSAELEEIYHAQVKARPVNLFILHKKGRYLLEPSNKDYSLKGIRQKYTQLEIIEMLNTTPEVFSPNVILRPICQDFILPTFCYIAGPSEIAYFGQYKNVYKHFGIEMPLIYPRPGITIVENKIQKILNKYNLIIQDFFIKYEALTAKVSEEISSIKIEDVFQEIDKTIDHLFRDLSERTSSIDKTLLGSLDKSREKIGNTFDIFKDKLKEAQKRNNTIALEQLDKTLLNVFPKSNFQEREINIIYFLNKYNLNFIEKIFEEMDVESYNHQVMYL